MNNMHVWWAQLQDRERRFIRYGGITAIVLLFYVLLWSPFLDNVSAAQQDLEDKRQLLQWMQTASVQFQQLKKQGHGPANLSTDNMLSTVSQSLKDSALASLVSEIKQTNDLKVTVNFKQVNFDDLIQWLLNIRKQYGLQVDQIQIEQVSTAPGLVQAALVLK